MTGGDFLSIVKTHVPMTSAECNETILRIIQRYPFCRSQVLTDTAFGRPVRTLVLGNGPRQVLFTAAHHANEWITATLLLKFGEELAEAISSGGKIWGVPSKTIQEQVTVHLVPMVNPDGVDLVTGAILPGSEEYRRAQALAANYPAIPFPDGWKANLNGVDLNLQYPAGWLQAREIKFSRGFTRPGPRDYVGRYPLSQREASALALYTEEVDPRVVLALHSQGQVIYWQFENYTVPGARELAEEFARVSGYELEETPYASSFAGYKDWFIQVFRRPGFTIEVGSGENPLPLGQFDQIYREILGILVTAATGLPGGA
jgi:g-D-glutamyl-meso-diaminopimelate peptidase